MSDITVKITRDTIDDLLDKRLIYAAMKNGRWWQLRRNGKTQTWKRDPSRFRIPFKGGLNLCGAFTETDLVDGALNPEYFRHVVDITLPKGK